MIHFAKYSQANLLRDDHIMLSSYKYLNQILSIYSLRVKKLLFY